MFRNILKYLCFFHFYTYFYLSFVKIFMPNVLKMSGDAELTADVQRYISSHIR